MTVKRLFGSALVAAPIVALLAVAVHASTVLWPSGIADIHSYWNAAELLRQGGEGLYEPTRLPDGVWPYLYPPAFAAAFAFLGLLPVGVAFPLWAVVVAGSVVFAFLSLEALGQLSKWQVALLVLALVLPVFQLVIMGQVDAFVVGLLALGLMAEREGRPRAAGVFIGLAAAIKVVPILALLPLLFLRRWTTAWCTVATAAVVSLLPVVWLLPQLGPLGAVGGTVGLHVDFVTRVVIRGFGQAAAEEWMLLPTNASLPGTSLRLLGTPAPGALAMWILIGGGTWLAYRRRDLALGVALVVTGASIGNFVFWPHSVFQFSLPLAVAFSYAGTAVLLMGVLAFTWISPMLGTLGYVVVWGVVVWNSEEHARGV